MDPSSILYMTGSAVGPYRLVKTRRPTPPPVSSSRHSASPNRASTRRASAPASGEPGPEPREELRSASSSGMAPTLATLSGGGTRARRAAASAQPGDRPQGGLAHKLGGELGDDRCGQPRSPS